MKARRTANIDTIKRDILLCRGVTDDFDAMVIESGGELERSIVSQEQTRKFSEILLAEAKNGKKITVFADYDADGISSAAIAARYIDNATLYIPERKDGYGLTDKSVAKIDEDTSLVITVDCGIRSKDIVEELKNSGKQVIVTDHHEVVDRDIPDALIVHPKLSKSVFTGYSGSGVIYKTLKAVYEREDPYAMQYAAIGTIADVMPMRDENRLIVRKGLQSIRENPSIGLFSLLNAAKRDYTKITETDISFYIAPMINACGRISNARIALDLLLERDEKTAAEIAERIRQINDERKQMTKKMSMSAIGSIVHCGKVVISVLDENVSGSIGLIANELYNVYKVPAIVFCSKGDIVAGSCRGPESFDCSKMALHIDKYTLSGGGHRGAAGVSVERENLGKVIDAIIDYADLYPSARYSTDVMADFEIDIVAVPAIIGNVNSLRPYGHGFEAPTFTSTFTVDAVKAVGRSGEHSKIVQDGVDCMLFGTKTSDAESLIGETVSIMYEMGEEYNTFTKRPSVIVREREVLT